MKKLIVILAKSAKYGDYCVAGIELATNKWIRPISHNEETEDAVPAAALTYADKTEVQLLDIVQIDFEDTRVENEIQPENYFFSGAQWKKFGRWTLADFEKNCGFDNTDLIFYDTSRRIEPEALNFVTRRKSLLILPIENISVKTNLLDEQIKFRADFNYNGVRYKDFSVGDIALREKFINQPCGEFFIAKKAVATFSLTNPYKDNRCYKMLANLYLIGQES